MQKSIISRLLIVVSIFISIQCQSIPKVAFSSKEFSQRVFTHVEALAEIGVRTAGTEKERDAESYIEEAFKKTGIETRIESFDFEVYEIDSAQLFVGLEKYKPDMLGIDPYASGKIDTKTAFIYDPGSSISRDDIFKKTIVTNNSANHFRLMALGANAVVYLDSAKFTHLDISEQLTIDLQINGRSVQKKSANVIGLLRAPIKTDEEILISAHYDTYLTSPGANDNGTGVGAIIELARIFAENRDRLTYNLRFVAFGAEEVGLLGSRVYLESHATDLKNIKLAFNLDTIGGEGTICVETKGGITTDISMISNQFPDYLMNKSWESLKGKWRIMNAEIMPVLMQSTIPDWLSETVSRTASAQSIDIHMSSILFSDVRTFAQAGIPATGVAQKTGSPILHTPDDTPEKINLTQIEDAGELCYAVIMNLMKSMEPSLNN